MHEFFIQILCLFYKPRVWALLWLYAARCGGVCCRLVGRVPKKYVFSVAAPTTAAVSQVNYSAAGNDVRIYRNNANSNGVQRGGGGGSSSGGSGGKEYNKVTSWPRTCSQSLGMLLLLLHGAHAQPHACSTRTVLPTGLSGTNTVRPCCGNTIGMPSASFQLLSLSV